jgi:hypothetical protein
MLMAKRSKRRRAHSGRVRKSVLVGTVSLGSLAVVGNADAASNFGGLIYNGPNNYGGRSNVTVPPNATTETVASNEIMLHRVVTQGNNSSGGVGLIQTGLYRSGPNVTLDACNTSVNQYQYYVENLVAGSGNYKCNLYGTAPFGHDEIFKVTGDGSSNWQAGGADYQSGYSYTWGYGALGFPTGFTAISTEMNRASNTVADGSTSNVVYGGGAGSDPSWSVYKQPSYGGVHRVASSETRQFPHTNPGSVGSSGTWSVPNVPTPVRFKHSP